MLLINTPEASPARVGRQATRALSERILGADRRGSQKCEAQMLLRAPGRSPQQKQKAIFNYDDALGRLFEGAVPV